MKRQTDSPALSDISISQYLTTHGWTNSETVKMLHDKQRNTDQVAAKVAELVLAGPSDGTIATMLRTSPHVVKEARSGIQQERKVWNRNNREGLPAKAPRQTYRDLASIIKPLFSGVEPMSIAEASRRMRCSEVTARKAYDLAFPDAIQRAMAIGEPPQRSNRSRLGRQEIERIKELLRQGAKQCDIESEISCSRATFSRIKSKMYRQSNYSIGSGTADSQCLRKWRSGKRRF